MEARNSLGDSSASRLEEKEALALSSGKRVRCISEVLFGGNDWNVVLTDVGRAVVRRGRALDFGSVEGVKARRLVVGVP